MKQETAARAAAWWASRLQVEDKREAFREDLAKRLESLDLNPLRRPHLQVDYDPQGPLLEAVRAVGIQCSGSFFSANGILPKKTRMNFIDGDTIEAAEGYGEPYKVLE